MTSFFDSDRQVSKAANDSFLAIFDTQAKRNIVWEKYSKDVVQYVSDVLKNETAKTISLRF